MSIAHKVRSARMTAGLTQLGLAKVAKIDPSTISRIEIGKVKPKVETLQILARACGVPLAKLIDGSPDDEEPAAACTAA